MRPILTESRAIARLTLAITCLMVLLGSLALPAVALADDQPKIKQAKSAIIVDGKGNVLWEKNSEDEMSLASVTKVMTAMVTLDSGMDLDSKVTCSDVDLGPDSQTAGYKKGDTTTLRSLLEVMLVYSGNDAATMVARAVTGDETKFVEMMNAKATELGMTHTHFSNCHGLEEEGKHYSCASDMVKMGRYALENYPFIAQTVVLPEVTTQVGKTKITFESTDELVGSYEGMLGIKTGSVESGTTFLGACERDGVRLYTAILGCKDNDGRFADTRALLDWAFDSYRTATFGTSGLVFRMAPYAFDARLKVPVYYGEATTGLVKKDGDAISYSNKMIKPSCLVESGMPYGTLTWSQGDRTIGSSACSTGRPMANVPDFGPFITRLFVNEAQLLEACA